jgi:AAHS family 4-hydroxybenzoate transporter-like MFS transporter
VLNDGGEAAAQAQQGPQGLRLVFSQKYLVGTLALWVTYFMGLVIVYGLVNWMPVLFKEAGVPASQAAVIAALFQLGGVGAIFVGLLMDRWNANLIIATGYFLTSLGVAFGQVLGGGVACWWLRSSLPVC